MRIATVYIGRRGGGNLYTYYIACALERLGKVEQKLFLHKDMENLKMFKQKGFDMETFETFDSLSNPIAGLHKIPSRFSRLQAAIKEYKPDVIYVTMFNPYVPLLFRAFPDTKKIYTLHGITSSGGLIRTETEKRLQKETIGVSNYVITLSKHYQKWMKQHFPGKKAFLLPHPSFDYFAKLGKKAIVKGKYILFIGRISEEYKGFGILQQAFEKIKNKLKIKLVAAGKSGYVGKDPSYVFIDRWLSDKEFASLIRHAWIVCLPYTQPTPSGVIAAVLALNKPIIASDLSGLNEQIVHGKNGILVPAGDAKALANAIERLFKNKKTYAKLKQGAKAAARQFGAVAMAKQLGKIVREVTK